MNKLQINPGDTVARIAGATGFAPDTIWSHPDNAQLKDQRDHMDVLAAGDHLTVPDLTVKSLSLVTGKRYRFRLKGVPMRFILQVLDAWGNPRSERSYRLVVDGDPLEGITDENGVLRHFIPNSARTGRLFLDELELELAFGELEPKSTLLGVQQRLSNLGFSCLADAGKMGRDTVLALQRFQRLMGLPETGELDDATRRSLDEHHQQVGLLAQHISSAEPDL
ncbi:MAG: peptidoglycan-binding domain-containing protein [Pyrinomonadaceae bacterium]